MNRKKKLQKVKRKFKMYKHPIVQRIAMVFIHGCKTAEAQELLQNVSDICDQNNALVDEFNRINNMTAQELLDKVKELRVNEVAKLLADGKDPPPMLRSELPIIVPVIESTPQTPSDMREWMKEYYPEALDNWEEHVRVEEYMPPSMKFKGNAKVYDADNKEVEPTPVNGDVK